MKITLSIPSKTFLLGEYFVLKKGQGLIAATEKRFRLQVELSNDTEIHGIPEGSPAERFITENKIKFSKMKLEFVDPYSGTGGLGASTAQFALVFAVAQFGIIKNSQDLQDISLVKDLLQSYREFSWSGKGIQPSGADLIGQWCGGLTAIDTYATQCDSFDWVFEDLDFLIARTGNKLATHEHLSELKADDFSKFRPAYNMAMMALSEKKSDEFVMAVKEYGEVLKNYGLVAKETEEILQILDLTELSEAHKGCGALGVDTVVLFFRPKQRRAILDLCAKIGIEPMASSEDLSPGIVIEENSWSAFDGLRSEEELEDGYAQ